MSVLNKVVIPRTRKLQKLGVVSDTVGAEREDCNPIQHFSKLRLCRLATGLFFTKISKYVSITFL